ncbi:MAG: hypothetical protein IJ943_02250 [Akkermansia sp.]|nr:hypothetical protein [Akkermansia sp.]
MKYGLLIATAACLSSCIYSDLGRTIGSIGTKVPRIVPSGTTEIQNIYSGQLYRKDGKYYVELPLVWVPERRKGYECMPLYNTTGDQFNDKCTYNRPYTAEELQQYTVEKIYYEVMEPPIRIRPELITHFRKPDANGARGVVSATLKPAEDFTPQGAESLGLYGIDGAPHHIGHLEKRRADYYPLLLPLQVVATAVDIPLSIVLMPVSTPILCAAMEADCEAAFPYHDESRREFSLPFPLYPTEESQKTQ